MSGEAQQLSFMQGEISPEFYYRSDLTTFNSSLSKAANVKLGPLGGLSNRKGSTVQRTEASVAGKTYNLQTSSDYVACVFQHFITKKILKLEVFSNAGEVTIYCAGVELNKEVRGASTAAVELKISAALLDGLKGLHFVIHNDVIIFSKTLPILYTNADIVGYTQYTLPNPLDAANLTSYTETQFCIRMIPPVAGSTSSLAGIRLESNLTLQNAANLTVPYVTVLNNARSGTVTGNASYALVAEAADGTDTSLYVLGTLPGVTLTFTTPAGSITDTIPYPTSSSTNFLNFTSVSSHMNSFGGKEITKLKIYRTTGKHTAYNSLYKLVAKFGVDGAASVSVTDNGQEEPAYTVCCDTSAMYKQPSFHSICNTPIINALTGGLKTVVDTAVFQQRGYYAINKGQWWGTSVYNNTIVVSRVGAVGQVIFPQISNPSEAFQFNVPEERGGFLTHLASMSRLVAFTNTSTFIIQGDDAGIITPTSINPFKVLSFGCMKGVPPVVSGDTCLFASTGGGVGYLSLASDGGAVGGNASALASHMFENKTILSIVPVEDRKSLPRFLINTTDGDVYECYKVGEVFAFFRVEMLGKPAGVTAHENYPMTVVHAPTFAKSSFGAEAYINYKYTMYGIFVHIDAVSITPEPLLQSKFLDFNSQLDYATSIGSWSDYVTDVVVGVPADIIYYANYTGWKYTSQYSVAGALPPHIGYSYAATLDDPLGTWAANNPIQITDGLVPLSFLETSFIVRDPYMKFTWLDSANTLQTIYAKINKVSPIYTYCRNCTFEFDVEVPMDLRTKPVYLNAPVDSNIDKLLTGGYVIAELAFNKVEFGDSTDMYAKAKGFCNMMGYEIGVLGTIAAPIEIPITLELNGNVYGNYKDPLETVPVVLKHYYDTPAANDGVTYPLGNYFKIDLPEFCSWFSMGAPAIGEIETLPVASMAQDITDAKKNIDYASVIVYNTKGLRIGEVGQPDAELERLDFTTDDSVTEAVAFSGPKSYNFSSTWNDHGMVRVSGMDLQPFNISGIIPKGNVGGFNG
jgi:hypothetical protein